jgi:hypothetical protein
VFTVVAYLDGMALGFKIEAKPFGEVCFVFYDEDAAHAW